MRKELYKLDILILVFYLFYVIIDQAVTEGFDSPFDIVFSVGAIVYALAMMVRGFRVIDDLY